MKEVFVRVGKTLEWVRDHFSDNSEKAWEMQILNRESIAENYSRDSRVGNIYVCR